MSRFFAALLLLFLGTSFSLMAQDLPGNVPLDIKTQSGTRYTFHVEEAVTPQQHSQGLMYRQSLPKFGGMIFIFEDMRPVAFWMRNTPLPLDLLFIVALEPGVGRIVGIRENAVPYSEQLIPSHQPVHAVLEINGGTSAQLNLRPGDEIRHHLLRP